MEKPSRLLEGLRSGCDPGVYQLSSDDVRRLQALRSLKDFEFYCLAFVQGPIAIFLDDGEMDEHVLPGRPLDEAITLGSIEPLHCTLLSHNSTPFASAQVSNSLATLAARPPVHGVVPNRLPSGTPSPAASSEHGGCGRPPRKGKGLLVAAFVRKRPTRSPESLCVKPTASTTHPSEFAVRACFAGRRAGQYIQELTSTATKFGQVSPDSHFASAFTELQLDR